MKVDSSGRNTPVVLDSKRDSTYPSLQFGVDTHIGSEACGVCRENR